MLRDEIHRIDPGAIAGPALRAEARDQFAIAGIGLLLLRRIGLVEQQRDDVVQIAPADRIGGGVIETVLLDDVMITTGPSYGKVWGTCSDYL